jgi:hypothetical protein
MGAFARASKISLACIAHTNLGSSPTPCFGLLKSDSPPEPLPERLHSAKSHERFGW